MQITVEIPDELKTVLGEAGQDFSRTALEAIALEAYRQRRLTGYQLRRLLGISSRYALDTFLKEHKVYDYTIDDFEKDLATAGIEQEKQRPA